MTKEELEQFKHALISFSSQQESIIKDLEKALPKLKENFQAVQEYIKFIEKKSHD